MFTSYIAGIAAALTPCTVVLIPIFLYRFGIWGKNGDSQLKNISAIVQTLIGFLSSLLLIGLAFDHISKTEYFNLLRLVLGSTFVMIGVLQLAGRFSLNAIQRVSSPFALGLVFPWILSFAPCVLPIFSALISSELPKGEIYLKLLTFGLGLLTPAVLTAFLGNGLFMQLKKAGRAMALVEKFAGILIIVSGIYLNFQVLEIRSADIVIAGLVFGVMILGSGYYILFVKRRVTLSNILILLSIAILWGVFTFNCYSEAGHTGKIGAETANNAAICAVSEGSCAVCQRCAILFSIAAIVGAAGYVVANRSADKVIFKMPKVKFVVSE